MSSQSHFPTKPSSLVMDEKDFRKQINWANLDKSNITFISNRDQRLAKYEHSKENS